MYTDFKGVTLQDGANSINFCTAANAGIDTIYLIDRDGGLRPSSSVSTAGPATLVSNGSQIQKFVNRTKCTNVEAGCYSYCSDTCFRSVRYEVAASESQNIMLKVCRTFHGATCSLFAGSLRANSSTNAAALSPSAPYQKQRSPNAKKRATATVGEAALFLKMWKQ